MGEKEQSVWVDDISHISNATGSGVSAAGISTGADAAADETAAYAASGTASTAVGIAAASEATVHSSGAAAYTVVQGKPVVKDTEETERLKENYGFVAPAAFIYAVFYVFCMYKNGSGITFPFFVAGSLAFFGLCSSKLGITLKKGSGFYMAAMILLGISTFCTDDSRIIFFNKLGVFLLLMSLLLKQYCNTTSWKLGKFLGSICILVCVSLGEWGRPVTDGKLYRKNKESRPNKKIGYFVLGMLIGVPVLLVVLLLLASADAVFRQMMKAPLEAVGFADIFGVLFRIAFIFFASYGLIALLCKKVVKEDVKDRRNGEPVLAITVTVLLTLLYLLFSGIQIAGLFLGRLRLPEGYTYAMYAREGFFQLLAVSFLNLLIVLACLSFFRESKVLKVVLTVMSLCTFVMIASSAMRMMMYIRYYYLTFLRILVLWGLALLAVLFVGVVINIFRERFPLLRYSMAVVAVLYIALSFAHPDYIIAEVNIANVDGTQEFFLASEPYHDYAYLRDLCADAAPVLVPYLEEHGYHMEAFETENAVDYAKSKDVLNGYSARSSQEAFGYYWMTRMQQRTENLGLRTYNVSRHLAVKSIRKAGGR